MREPRYHFPMVCESASLLSKSMVPRWALLLAAILALGSARAQGPACDDGPDIACFLGISVAPGGAQLHFYASRVPGSPSGNSSPSAAIIAIHGHSRDANTTFVATLAAVTKAGRIDSTLVIAPIFQVADGDAAKCETSGVPHAQADDLLWTCQSWPYGGTSSNAGGISSFVALDALVERLVDDWPSLQSVTIAGFSAGAQMVQHYVGFAAPHPRATIRYVVADPGSWLYFDEVRPRVTANGVPVDWSACQAGNGAPGNCHVEFVATGADCPAANHWKYGTAELPRSLTRDAPAARAQYVEADISYLEGALDRDSAPGTAYRLLDRSCAASVQGSYRLQRGVAYAYYDRTLLAPLHPRRVTVVPGCAHSVSCVFESDAARAALLGR
jgi:hypothetical protein